MAKVIKKAQDGLRTGQYKRLGRIDEKNSARAERVAERMNTRASRIDRGKDIAGDRGDKRRAELDFMLNKLSDRKMPSKEERDKGDTLPPVTVTSSRNKGYTLPPVTVTSSRNKQKFGGKIIKKAQNGILSTKLKDVPGKVKKAATNVKDAVSAGFNKTVNKVKNTTVGDALKFVANPAYSAAESAVKSLNKGKSSSKKPILKSKNGGKQMIKRADGSTSQRGLWDNIRAAKGSGKKPTAAMLKQEKKIKAKTK